MAQQRARSYKQPSAFVAPSICGFPGRVLVIISSGSGSVSLPPWIMDCLTSCGIRSLKLNKVPLFKHRELYPISCDEQSRKWKRI